MNPLLRRANGAMPAIKAVSVLIGIICAIVLTAIDGGLLIISPIIMTTGEDVYFDVSQGVAGIV
jgi:hypothetical protein